MQEVVFQVVDTALRTLSGSAKSARVCEGAVELDFTPLEPNDQALAAALMRVNHVGEVCAQALYSAQAVGARVFSGDEALAQHMEQAASEEMDHLAWTQARLKALNSHPSLLNPIWYAGSFAIGLLAARMGPKASLGFVVETERQVEAHLNGHLSRLPASDAASRAVVSQMCADEAKHARQAQQAGAMEMPLPVRLAMKAAAKVMTTVAHKI